jgi:protein-disulfide isomerase
MAIPIPKRPSGYRRGTCEAAIQIDAFVDIECPFSKKAWPTLLAVNDQYNRDQISIVVHPIVLADHRQSWDVTKAAIVLSKGDPERFWEAFTYLYSHQKDFFIEAFDPKTRIELYSLLADYAKDFGDYSDTGAFIEQIKLKETEQQAKVSIRYAIRLGIWSAPTFLINGSQASELSSSSSLSDWRKIVDPLLT